GPEDNADEYGDPFDFMGSGEVRHNGIFHKLELGVPALVPTITSDGDYSLEAIEYPSSGAKGLRINIPWKSGWAYYLEYRTPYGSFGDQFSALDPVVNGVLMHLAPTITKKGVAGDQYLLDATPWTDDFNDAALQVGHVYYDQWAKIRIETLKAENGVATVRIKFNATQLDGSPSCADVARVRNWGSGYCDNTQTGEVCGP